MFYRNKILIIRKYNVYLQHKYVIYSFFEIGEECFNILSVYEAFLSTSSLSVIVVLFVNPAKICHCKELQSK